MVGQEHLLTLALMENQEVVEVVQVELAVMELVQQEAGLAALVL
jgi:hypothetical protein